MPGPTYRSELWATPAGPALLTERPLGDGWYVASTVFVQGDELVIGEVRIFPGTGAAREPVPQASKRRRPRRSVPSSWNLQRSWGYARLDDGSHSFEENFGDDPAIPVGEWDGNPSGADPLPAAGVTHSTLRDVLVGEILADARVQMLVRDRSHLRSLADDDEAAAVAAMATAPVRTGRAGADDRRYLPWALRYTTAIGKGSQRPIADLSEETGVTRSVVRDTIHETRRRGLLPPASRGRASGVLTEKARSLLATEQDARKPAKPARKRPTRSRKGQR